MNQVQDLVIFDHEVLAALGPEHLDSLRKLWYSFSKELRAELWLSPVDDMFSNIKRFAVLYAVGFTYIDDGTVYCFSSLRGLCSFIRSHQKHQGTGFFKQKEESTTPEEWGHNSVKKCVKVTLSTAAKREFDFEDGYAAGQALAEKVMNADFWADLEEHIDSESGKLKIDDCTIALHRRQLAWKKRFHHDVLADEDPFEVLPLLECSLFSEFV